MKIFKVNVTQKNIPVTFTWKVMSITFSLKVKDKRNQSQTDTSLWGSSAFVSDQ